MLYCIWSHKYIYIRLNTIKVTKEESNKAEFTIDVVEFLCWGQL